MKQNPDCMRDVLMQIEEQQGFDSFGVLKPLPSNDLLASKLSEIYEEADVVYSVKQLWGCGLVDAKEQRTVRGMSFEILDVTSRGHEFLNNIRSDGVWAQTKKHAKQAGSFAVEILSKIAAEIIINKIGVIM